MVSTQHQRFTQSHQHWGCYSSPDSGASASPQHICTKGGGCAQSSCYLGQGNLFTLQSLIWHFCQQIQALTAAAASLCAAPRPCTLLSTIATSPRACCFHLPPPSYLYCLSAPLLPQLSLQTFIFASHNITAKPPRSHKNLSGSQCEGRTHSTAQNVHPLTCSRETSVLKNTQTQAEESVND